MWGDILLLAASAMSQAQTASPALEKILAEVRAAHYSDARSMIEQALKISPNEPRLWTLDGFVLVHLGDAKDALSAYQQALRLSTNYLPALEGAAEIEYKAGNQDAVALLKKILKIHPDDETTHAMLASLAFNRGDCSGATEEFARGRSAIDAQTSALEEYGSCLVKLRRVEDAIPIFERLADIQPNNARARYNLAVVQALAGRSKDVIATLTTRAPAARPDADTLDLLAEAYEVTGDTPHAVETLRQAIVQSPDVPQHYVEFANLSFAHSSFQVGVDMVSAGLKRMPGTASLYLARGILYVQLGKYDEAENDFAEAERLDPKGQFGSSVRGLEELESGNLDEAEATVRDRLRKSPNDAFLHYLLAETLMRKGAQVGSPQFNEALAAAQTAIQLQPNLAVARDVLARMYLQAGRNDQAIEQSRLAFKADPTDQTALYHLIAALRKNNDTRELPALAKKLAELREQARIKEAEEHRYSLVEPQVPGQRDATAKP